MIVVDASVWVSVLVRRDLHHAVSRRWLAGLISHNQAIAAPLLLTAEVGGAVARQTGRPELGRAAIERLLALPTLRLVRIDHRFGLHAARLAAERRLRGADAYYVALAAELSLPLVSWDREQIDRAAPLVSAYSPE
jgi:predicted nucleic acid-binding protein